MILLSIAHQLQDRLAALERVANTYQSLIQVLNESTLDGELPAGAAFSLSLSLPGEADHSVAVGAESLPKELRAQLVHDAAARASHQVVSLWQEILAIATTGWEHCQTAVAATQAVQTVNVDDTIKAEAVQVSEISPPQTHTLPSPQSPGPLHRPQRSRIATPQVAPAPMMPVVGVGAAQTNPISPAAIVSRFGRPNNTAVTPK